MKKILILVLFALVTGSLIGLLLPLSPETGEVTFPTETIKASVQSLVNEASKELQGKEEANKPVPKKISAIMVNSTNLPKNVTPFEELRGKGNPFKIEGPEGEYLGQEATKEIEGGYQVTCIGIDQRSMHKIAIWRKASGSELISQENLSGGRIIATYHHPLATTHRW